MNQRKKYWGSKQAFERQNSSKRRLFLVAVTQLYKRLCPSVRPSVGPSVRNTCAKTAFLGWFRPRWDPVLNLMINKRVLRASFTILSLHLSVHLYLHICHIFSAKVNTRKDASPDTSLPGRTCLSVGHHLYSSTKIEHCDEKYTRIGSGCWSLKPIWRFPSKLIIRRIIQAKYLLILFVHIF